MTKSTRTTQILPAAVNALLKQLGRRIRVARQEQNLTAKDLSARAGMTQATLLRLEKGSPTVGLGVLCMVLWVLGIHQSLANLAYSESLAKQMRSEPLVKRIRNKKKSNDLSSKNRLIKGLDY